MVLKKTLFIIAASIVILIGVRLDEVFRTPALPPLISTWWGAGEYTDDKAITKFKISVSDEVIQDLKNRLNNTRVLTPPLRGIQQQYGFNTNTLKEVIDYWLNKYDWQKRENYLNQFPQFRTNIQGLRIHYIHVKPDVPSGTPVYPLLILHGWPGSVREFYKIIPLLTKIHKKYGFAFEVVAPSLPGYAYSDGAVRPGLGAAEVAIIMRNLMIRIGHDKFYVQGGDWGAIVAKNLATLFPNHIQGLHTNFALSTGPWSLLKIFIGSWFPSYLVPEEYAGTSLYPLTTKFQHLLEESGYYHIQATKPDTVGVGINDSPAGLAAYILEKFSTGTNRNYKKREDAGLLQKYTYDELIDNLMLYWITGSFTTASRLYAESASKKQHALRLESIPIDASVPCAVARFPFEIFYFPDWILRDKYANLIHATDFKEGGHFAAFEVPHLLAEDIFSAIDKMVSLRK